MQRRTLIIGGVAAGIGLFEYSTISRWMNNMRAPAPLSVKAYEHYGAQAAVMAITPNDDFYITSKGTTPYLKSSEWKLQFSGLVKNAFTLSYADVLALPVIEKEFTLECISNPIGGHFFGNAKWTGTPLRPLLDRAEPAPEAKFVALHGADGLSSGHPIERILNEENFLAYKMNGEDLPPDHGYPVRIFIPGKYGMKQPKWITRVEFVSQPYQGYWESQGWSDTCERWAHARFTDLHDGAKISAQNFEFVGYALGNLDGIGAVQISFDDGASWKPTDLFSNPSALLWTFWRYVWENPKPGTYKVRVRAVDGQGRVEGDTPRDIFPDGATGQQIFKIQVV